MAWYWWVVVAVFTYFSLGFAYFPIFDQCVDRTRAQWLVVSLFYFFTPAVCLMFWVCVNAEKLMLNIERNPGSIGCVRLQKALFWMIFGLPLFWINTACWTGVAVLKILGVSERFDDSPDRHDI